MIILSLNFSQFILPYCLQGKFDDHSEWGVCQVGTSASFVKTEDRMSDGEKDLALFGAPGDKTGLFDFIFILRCTPFGYLYLLSFHLTT